MPELLKTSPILLLPDVEDIEDLKIKRIFEEYNKALEEFVIATYSDITRLHERLGEVTAWTPALKFGGNAVDMTYTHQAGLYIKIGRQVAITGYFLLSSKGTSTGNVTITGLPFACKNANGAYAPVTYRLINVTFTDVYQGRIEKGTTTMNMNEVTNGGVETALTNADFANNSNVLISATYFTD